MDTGLGFGFLRRSRQLLLHCSTFARPWARTAYMTAKDGGNAKELSGTILAHVGVRRNDKHYFQPCHIFVDSGPCGMTNIISSLATFSWIPAYAGMTS